MSRSLAYRMRDCASPTSKSLLSTSETAEKKRRELLRSDLSSTVVAAAVAPPLGGALGTTGKSNSAPHEVDPETGEVLLASPPYNPAVARVERFALQSAVRKLMPNSPTSRCLRSRQKGKEIQVLQSKEHGTASYCGLQTCSSVWRCSVCSAKISERRRVELQSAIAQHTASGGQVLLLTLTHPHSRDDDLGDMLVKQATALKSFTGNRASRRVFAGIGLIGSVRAFEVTHGRKREVSHGWHPHYHILMFCRSGVDLAALTEDLFALWKSACVRAGLKAPSSAHGVKLDDGTKAASYASKWGLESEMTRGHTKKKTDGESPFDLLRAYLATGDKQAGALFVEFAEAFHGKRQLFWSKGLKKRFAIGEATDEELAAKQDDEARILGTITLDQWREVLRVDGRGLVLQLAASGGWDAVFLYLTSISGAGGPQPSVRAADIARSAMSSRLLDITNKSP